MDGHNPYAPPTVAVDDVRGRTFDASRFNPEGRSVAAGQGWGWYKEAWQIFKVQPLKFWGAILLLFLAMVVLSLVPFVNLVVSLLMPAFVAGFGVCARSVQRTGRFDIGQIFDGFRTRLGTQVLAGLLYLVVLLVGLGILVVAFGASGLFAAFTGGANGSQAATAVFGSMGGAFFLAYFVVMIGIASTIVFAPYIIQETQLSAPQAMLASVKGSFKNVPAFLVGLLVYIGLGIVATIPVGLGWLVLIPVLFLTVYVSYTDIFYD